MFGFFRRDKDALAETSKKLHSMETQLQARIRELEAQRSQLEGILQGMTEGVLVEGSDGGLLLINPAARGILGLEGEVAPGMQSFGLIRHPVLREMIDQVRAGGHPRARDLTLLSPSERHLRVRGDVCRSPAGPATLLVFHDITDLKRLETLRRDFVANVSHELKTPLTAIQGCVETLLGGALKDADRGQPFIESISEETGRLRRLVDDLLTLAQVESKEGEHKAERIELGPFLESEILRHRPEAAGLKVALNLETVPPEATLLADREQLSQAIGNLMELNRQIDGSVPDLKIFKTPMWPPPFAV